MSFKSEESLTGCDGVGAHMGKPVFDGLLCIIQYITQACPFLSIFLSVVVC